MDKKIFFSWQSDFPLISGTIRKSIKNSVKELKKRTTHSYYSNDEATRNISGSISIEDAIFRKIEKSNIFIADLTIVNYSKTNETEKLRITPNPNVLIELGFASNAIGWERIITIIDSSQDLFRFLPFDIRSHRTIKHNFKNWTNEKLTSRITSEVKKIEKYEQSIFNLVNHVSSKVDRVFLNIFNHIMRFFPGKSKNLGTLEFMIQIKGKRKLTIEKEIKKEKIMAFHAWQSLDYLIHEIELLLSNPLIVNNLSKSGTSILIDLLKHLDNLEFYKTNGFNKIARLSTPFYKETYKVESIENTRRKRLLLKGGNHFFTASEGNFNFFFHDHELIRPLVINSSAKSIVNCIFGFITAYKEWLKTTGRN